MKRIDLRSRDGWRDFDVGAFKIALLLPLLLLGLTWAGYGPHHYGIGCCGAPATASVGADANGNMPGVDLLSVGGTMVLAGTVASPQTKATLLDAATKAFGAGNVSDQLTVDATVAPVGWLAHANDIIAELKPPNGDGRIATAGPSITLTGAVADDKAKLARGTRAAALFGPAFAIDNRLTIDARQPIVPVPPVAVAQAPPVDPVAAAPVPVPVPPASVAATPTLPPVDASASSLLPSRITLSSADGIVTLRGSVQDEASRSQVVGATTAEFGPANVIDKLAISNAADNPVWLGKARDVAAMLKGMPGRASVRTFGPVVGLTGTVPDQATWTERAKRTAEVFGNTFRVDNMLVIGVAASPTPAKVDCGLIADGTTIEFATGSADLTEIGQDTLDDIGDCLKVGQYEVDGHTDSVGNSVFNQGLSERRAQAAVSYLLEKPELVGVKLKAAGFGEARPIGDNTTPAGRAKNRRITFKRIAE
jgi:outer membrane protein OmpA-like peptidoglycan-associated protein